MDHKVLVSLDVINSILDTVHMQRLHGLKLLNLSLVFVFDTLVSGESALSSLSKQLVLQTGAVWLS